MASLAEVARALAQSHRQADPETVQIRLVSDSEQAEVRLLEVSQSAPYTGEVLPFRFAPHPDSGVDFPSVVVLVNPEEYRRIMAGDLRLPTGWDLSSAEDL